MYGYIAESLRRFPNRRDLGAMVERLGFVVEYRRQDMGGLMETIVLRKC